MAVSSDDHIYSVCRIERRRKLLVIFNTDMRKQNSKIDVSRTVRIADLSDLRCRILYIYKGADKPLALCIGQHLLSQYADEHHTHPVDLFYVVRVEKTVSDIFYIHVCIYDRK